MVIFHSFLYVYQRVKGQLYSAGSQVKKDVFNLENSDAPTFEISSRSRWIHLCISRCPTVLHRSLRVTWPNLYGHNPCYIPMKNCYFKIQIVTMIIIIFIFHNLCYIHDNKWYLDDFPIIANFISPYLIISIYYISINVDKTMSCLPSPSHHHFYRWCIYIYHSQSWAVPSGKLT